MKKSHPYRVKPAFILFSNIVIFFLQIIYRVKPNIPKEVKQLKKPYLLLANHVGFYDPFFISHFLWRKPHFVSSDAVMKDKVKGFFMRGFGVIPIKKNMNDSQTIRVMKTVVNEGGAIGLFPEGARTWTGETLPIEPSIGKLAKFLNVPIVTAKMKGMFSFNPRWAHTIRRGRVEIDYNLIVSAEEIKELKHEEITRRIKQSLSHSEVAYQRENKIKFHSRFRAEYMNHVLFYCTSCGSFEGFNSNGNQLICSACNAEIFVHQYGFLESKNKLPYNNLEDAFAHQLKAYSKYINAHIEKNTSDAIIEEQNMIVYKENEKGEFTNMGKGSVILFLDRIEIDLPNKATIKLEMDEIQTLNPQFRERIELFYKKTPYRFVGEKPGVSGVKWELACSLIWKSNKQNMKLTPYVKAWLNDI